MKGWTLTLKFNYTLKKENKKFFISVFNKNNKNEKLMTHSFKSLRECFYVINIVEENDA